MKKLWKTFSKIVLKVLRFEDDVQTIVKPASTSKGQRYPTDYSPQVLRRGLGFGWTWLLKQKIKGSRSFEIADTNSMVPVMDNGHLLPCEPLTEKDWDTLKVNDICVYEFRDGSLIVHRITKLYPDTKTAIFKGDNNLFSDLPVKYAQIKWRVLGVFFTR
jgi:hypothetical protein